MDESENINKYFNLTYGDIFIFILIMLICILLNFIFYKEICVYGENKNEFPCKLNRIYGIHIHHWIIHLLCLLFIFMIPGFFLKAVYLGLNVGGIIHGIICYDDWNIILITY